MTNFTISYNTQHIEGLRRYWVTFASDNGERHTTWLMEDIDELIARVNEWETDAPILGYTIKSIEQREQPRPSPMNQWTVDRDNLRLPAISALKRMGYK